MSDNVAKSVDFGGKWAETYTRNCECGKEIVISTQQDYHPEYYTDIHVRCDCGKSVHFNLPVN